MATAWLSDGSRLLPALAQCLALCGLMLVQPGRALWLLGLLGIAGLGLYAWLAELRRVRAIQDTPVTRIASAAQGYVALRGAGRPLPGSPVLSPARYLPCLWYRYRRYQRQGDDWTLADSGESETEFLLDDGSARCLLRPAEMRVETDRVDTYTDGDTRVVEETLLVGETLHVLGRYASLDGPGADTRRQLDGVLHEWKANQASLLQRFDRDGNGSLDAGEWQAALAAAHAEAQLRSVEPDEAPDAVIEYPGDGRPGLIANHEPAALARSARRYAWFYAASVLLALLGLAYPTA